jgi:hypothetical protein
MEYVVIAVIVTGIGGYLVWGSEWGKDKRAQFHVWRASR